NKKSGEFKNIIKIGRTHLQDATPITLGQEFSAYSAQIRKGIHRVTQTLDGLAELAIGGTAVGTGINTHPQFGKKVCQKLVEETGFKFRETDNHFEAQAAKDACVFTSGALKTLAVSLMKIVNDLRWLASGPRCGLFEIELPTLQAGSSIMPGKLNPVIPEAVAQIAAQVIGNDAAITIGCQAGNFELNVMMPLIAHNLIESVELLSSAALSLADKCVLGIKANEKHCEAMVEKSLAMVTSLAPVLGYDKSAKLAKEAFAKNETIRALLEEEKILPKKELEKLLDPRSMLAPKKD
ncbi:MAG: aspartate ammonia-lyase, partial [Deltaproteobacteria bacterium]|nr:aspartate ammonia-lyase [Deltaproteobacteria bacterium]